MRQFLMLSVAVGILVTSALYALANEQPHGVPTPTPNPYSLPGLSQLLSNQGVQIWALQNQVKTLQGQVTALQNALSAQQKSTAALQQQLTQFQAAYAKHTHLYENAGSAMGIDTIPQMYCTSQGAGGSCFSTGTVTIMTYAGHNASMVSTSPPR